MERGFGESASLNGGNRLLTPALPSTLRSSATEDGSVEEERELEEDAETMRHGAEKRISAEGAC
jgi:hypothetical protein